MNLFANMNFCFLQSDNKIYIINVQKSFNVSIRYYKTMTLFYCTEPRYSGMFAYFDAKSLCI